MSEVREGIEHTAPNTLILPDGNRRWAKEHGVPYSEAYEQGARRIVECTRHLGALGMRQAWFGVARPFNFEREWNEVRSVLDACLMIRGIGQREGDPFNITVNGDLCLMPPSYLQAFKSQEEVYDPDGVTAHLLIGWDSDIELGAFTRWSRKYPEQTVDEQLINSSAVSEKIGYLIRTGIRNDKDEQDITVQGGRVSGMIPLHSLGAELHFEPTYFPDFTTDHLNATLVDYASRNHRDQVSL